MTRDKSFEEMAEKMGMGDDLPDTIDRHTCKIEDTEIDEETYGLVMDKIERYTENHVNDGKKLNIRNYPIVTGNPDVSYACNPWCDDVLTDALIKRIEEAKKRVKFNF